METIFRKILCPTDFSSFSENALKKAVKLSKIFNSELILIHVITNPWAELYSGDTKNFLSAEEVESVVKKKLRRLIEQHAKGVIATTRVAMLEHTYQGIIHAAEKENADLIVMATHGYTGAKRLVMGSVAENIVRKSSCSVLVVRGPSDV